MADIFDVIVNIVFVVMVGYHWFRTDRRLDDLEAKED